MELWHVKVDSNGLIDGGIAGVLEVLSSKTFPLTSLTSEGAYVTVTLDMPFTIPAGGFPAGEALALVLLSNPTVSLSAVDTCTEESPDSPGAPMISILSRGTTTGSPATAWTALWLPSGDVCAPGLQLTVVGCDSLPPPGPPEECEGDETEVQDFLNNLIDPQVSASAKPDGNSCTDCFRITS